MRLVYIRSTADDPKRSREAFLGFSGFRSQIKDSRAWKSSLLFCTGTTFLAFWRDLAATTFLARPSSKSSFEALVTTFFRSVGYFFWCHQPIKRSGTIYSALSATRSRHCSPETKRLCFFFQNPHPAEPGHGSSELSACRRELLFLPLVVQNGQVFMIL